MKTRLLSLLLVMLASVMPMKLWAADGDAEPYAVLSDNNTKLTFYYDDQKEARGGMSVGPFADETDRTWHNQREYITTVEFDWLFSNCRTLTSTAYWFYNCLNLVSISGIYNLNIDNVTDMSNMFYGCLNLVSIFDVEYLNTENVTNMSSMFYGCSSLTSLDVSSFYTVNVTNMRSMFNGCSALKTIYVSSAWTTYAVTDGNDMFAGCTSLVGGAGTSYDASHVDYTYAHIDGGTSNPGYFTNVKEKPQPYAVLSENNTKLTFYYDDQREARGGMSVGPFYDSDDVTWYNQKNSITSAEFDPSFANCTTIYSTAYWFSGCWNMVSISGIQYLKTDNVTDMNDMFWGCSGLKSLDLSAFNTANVTNMNDMFGGCSGLKSLDLSAFNTANVTDMSYMFFSCMGLKTIDVSNFNTASVTIMEGMFAECTSLRRIYAKENWDFTNLKEERYMFRGCVDIVGGAGTRYNEYYVDNRYAHIDEGRSNPGYFTDKEAPIDMTLVPYAALGKNSTELTFYYNKDKDIEGGFSIEASDKYPEWLGYSDITTVIFDDSFAQCSTITSTAHWFSDCKKLTTIIGIDNLKTDNVADMSTMFAGCSALTSLDLSNFNTTNVTDMSGMFYDSALTSLDLSNFNTTNVTNMSGMFMFCSNLKTIYPGENWSTEKVTNSQNMFGGCYYLEGSAGTLYNGNYIDVTYAHIDEGRSNPGYFSDKNAPAYTLPYALLSNDSTKLTFYYDNQKVTKGGMGVGTFTDLSNNNINSGWNKYKRSITTIEFDSSFADCNTLTSTACWFRAFTNLTSIIGIENLNTSNVTDMNYMFNGCENLKELDLSSFNTDNVTDLSRMFQKCRALTSLDLSQFNTSNVVNMDNMFDKCSSLTTIYAGNAWTTKKVTSGKEMFYNCTSLVGGAGTKFDATHISYAYAHIDGGASNPGYFTDKNAAPVATVEPYAVLSDNNTKLTFYYDDQKEARGGMSVGPFGYYEDVPWYSQRESITSAEFDPSFANCTTLTSTTNWFNGCKNMVSISGIQYLKTDNVTDMSSMFERCFNLTSLDLSNFNTENVTDMHSMFDSCSRLASLNVSSFNTNKVTNMGLMFSACYELTSLDVSGFNTDNVTDMHGMFGGSSGLTSLDLSNFNTSNATTTSLMFEGCLGLTSLDLSSFNTENVTKFSNMFKDCSNLKTIYVGNDWNTSKAEEGAGMFMNCTSLVGGAGTTFDANHTDHTYAHIDGGTSNPGYFTEQSNSLVAYYPFNGNANDESGHGNHGEVIGNVVLTTDRHGNENGAYQFFGQEMNYISIPDKEILHLNTFTLSAWVYTDADGYGSGYLINKGRDIENGSYRLGVRSVGATNEYGGTNDAGINEFPETGMWHMITGTVEGNVAKYYLDGILMDEKTLTRSFSYSNTEPLTLGMHYYDGVPDMWAYPLRGILDDVRIYNRVLSSSEIADLFAEEGGGIATFNGLVAHVSGTKTLDEAFANVGGRSEAAKSIAAIVWHKTTPLETTDLQGLTDNPNLLVYVNEASLAPQGVQNVVINGVANEIVLTDVQEGNNNFYAPQAFVAERISYTRNFGQSTTKGTSRGWESIALPFDVQTIQHETKGVIAPFNNSASNKHFWLRRLTENGLQPVTDIEANIPYIISMPNSEEYTDDYNLNGRVTFSAQNVDVPATVTNMLALADSSIVMVPAMQRKERSSAVWALNVGEVRGSYFEGSVFERDYREVRPFEAYTVHRLENSQPAPRYIPIQEIGGTTGIDASLVNREEVNNEEWYDLEGRKLQGQPKQKGVYISKGKKVVIK